MPVQRYVAYLSTKAHNHILTHGLGDWYDLGPRHPGESQLTPKGLTATAMPLYLKLTTPENTAPVTARLLDGLRANDYRLTAGDVGYRYLLRALEGAGASDIIRKMNDRSDVPGLWVSARPRRDGPDRVVVGAARPV